MLRNPSKIYFRSPCSNLSEIHTFIWDLNTFRSHTFIWDLNNYIHLSEIWIIFLSQSYLVMVAHAILERMDLKWKDCTQGTSSLGYFSAGWGCLSLGWFFHHSSKTRPMNVLTWHVMFFPPQSTLPSWVGKPLPSSKRVFCLIKAVFTSPWSQTAFFCALFKQRMTVH